MLGTFGEHIYPIGDCFYRIVRIERSPNQPAPLPGMPDAPGLWKDGSGRVWVIDKHAQAFTRIGHIGHVFSNRAPRYYMPYTRIHPTDKDKDTMKTRSVTIAKLRREYWERIRRGEKRFEIRDEPVASTSTMFVFKDAATGEHLGNARILTEHRFGGECDNTGWTWELLAKLADTTIWELQELFPVAMQVGDEYTFHVYEIEPVSDDDLIAALIREGKVAS